MSDVIVGVVPVGDDRFSLVVSDPSAAPHQGPTIGDDLLGYDNDALCKTLTERHGISQLHVNQLIDAAQGKRASGG